MTVLRLIFAYHATSPYQDTGTWYGVAKLRGTNFLNGHIERGVHNQETGGYEYYYTGKR